VFAAVATAYMVVAVFIEEHDLVAHFGDAYRRYQDSTPKYLPRFGRRRAARVRRCTPPDRSPDRARALFVEELADRADHHRRGQIVRHRPVVVARERDEARARDQEAATFADSIGATASSRRCTTSVGTEILRASGRPVGAHAVHVRHRGLAVGRGSLHAIEELAGLGSA
jgi:hypothetical protein